MAVVKTSTHGAPTPPEDCPSCQGSEDPLATCTDMCACASAAIQRDISDTLAELRGYMEAVAAAATLAEGAAGSALRQALEAVERLQDITAALVTHAAAGRGAELGRVALGEVVAAAVEGLGDRWRDAASITVGPMPSVRANAQLLYHVFVALLREAVDRASADDAVAVTVSGRPVAGGWIIRISRRPQDAARVASVGTSHLRGERVPFADGPQMASARRIIDRHGGRLWTDVDGDGATSTWFTLRSVHNRS